MSSLPSVERRSTSPEKVPGSFKPASPATPVQVEQDPSAMPLSASGSRIVRLPRVKERKPDAGNDLMHSGRSRARSQERNHDSREITHAGRSRARSRERTRSPQRKGRQNVRDDVGGRQAASTPVLRPVPTTAVSSLISSSVSPSSSSSFSHAFSPALGHVNGAAVFAAAGPATGPAANTAASSASSHAGGHAVSHAGNPALVHAAVSAVTSSHGAVSRPKASGGDRKPGKSAKRSGSAEASDSAKPAVPVLENSARQYSLRSVRVAAENLLHAGQQALEHVATDVQAAFALLPQTLKDFNSDQVGLLTGTQAFRACSDEDKQRSLRNLLVLCLVVWDQTAASQPAGVRMDVLQRAFRDFYNRKIADLTFVLKQDFYSMEENWLAAHARKSDKAGRVNCLQFLDLAIDDARARGMYRTLSVREILTSSPYENDTLLFVEFLRKKATTGDWQTGLAIDIARSSYFFCASPTAPTHSMRSLEDFCSGIKEPAMQAMMGALANQNLTGFIVNQFFLRRKFDGSHVSLLCTADGQALSAPTWTAEYHITRIPGGYELLYSGYLGNDSQGRPRNTARAIVSQEILQFNQPTLQMSLTIRCLENGAIEFDPFLLAASNWHAPVARDVLVVTPAKPDQDG